MVKGIIIFAHMKRSVINFFDKYILIIIVISVVVALLIHFPEMISLSDIYESSSLLPGMRPEDVAFEILFTFFSLLILFLVNIRLFRYTKPGGKIRFQEVAFSFVLTWILSNLLGKFFVYLHHRYDVPAIDAMLHHYLHPLRDFIITCIVTGSSFIIHLMRQKQQMLLENQQLRTENLRNQYEALKQQLNPHMLFNSLNTLRSLVREDAEKAQDYIQELSRVLRYTLQVNESQYVSLAKELEFVYAYIFLQEMRYEDNLHFEINIDDELSLHTILPPMSVQLLIENAIKHNEISRRRPLVIRVITDEAGWLTVSNDIQPKLTGEPTTGIGLCNLNKRYNLLFRRHILITRDSGIFCVKIPLIDCNKV